MLITLFTASMWLTLLSASGTAWWLWSRRDEEPALVALAAFCMAMALWCCGHLAAMYNQPQLAIALLLANPLLPTSFLHFVVLWLRDNLSLPEAIYRFIPLLYLMALAVTALSIVGGGGHLAAWNIFPQFFHIDRVGWLNVVYTVVVGVVAHILLLFGYRNSRLRASQLNKRRSIIAMFIAGGWGFSLATSFILPSLQIDFFPYPMLALPTYAILLVYSVARYRLVEVNRWGSQALQWLAVLVVSMLLMTLLLSLLAPVAMTELADVPTLQLFSYSSLLLILAWLLYGPARQFSDRLVYPGATIDESTLNQWLQQLNSATSWPSLARAIETVWNQPKSSALQDNHTGVKIFASNGDVLVDSDQPTLFTCVKRGSWECHLHGWQDHPPSKQHMAELLATLIPNVCASLERSLQLAKVEAQAERERIKQQHLVELGGLTAAIAHELRNPLNIINMASAQTDPAIKGHIQNQVARAELLIRDTLAYAGKMELQLREMDLLPLVRQVCEQISGLYKVPIDYQLPQQLSACFDADKIQQILINLLENAAAFVDKDTSKNQQSSQKENTNAAILLVVKYQKDDKKLMLAVHNKGPAIPDDMLPHLFEPFITKRSGGTGLGLSIVRRIVDAHNGWIEHRDDLGWPVSFIITLPVPSSCPPHGES